MTRTYFDKIINWAICVGHNIDERFQYSLKEKVSLSMINRIIDLHRVYMDEMMLRDPTMLDDPKPGINEMIPFEEILSSFGVHIESE